MGAGRRAASVGQELFLYAVSAALSCLVLFVGLRHLDPNRVQAKKAAERKKEIAKRLNRPLIQTNTYEVTSWVTLKYRICADSEDALPPAPEHVGFWHRPLWPLA